ncbi:MAG: hypothetical protein HGJ93_00905 [Desulfosarcina sp.]|nr:hypothetical protein [Desulfosarcina sp.]MBC2764545.1 hypothetical protein [Desulfosarcina sp.]
MISLLDTNVIVRFLTGNKDEKFKGVFDFFQKKEKRIVVRTMEIWDSKNIEIVDAYLIACLEKDSQNILYSYDTDFDKFKIDRIEP